MRFQRHQSEDLEIVSRLQRDRRFALAFLAAVLRAGEGSDVALAFTQVARALDDVSLPPEAVDPEEARIVLERLERALRLEAREIQLA